MGCREGGLGIPYGVLTWGVFITPGMWEEMGMGVDRCVLQDGKGSLGLGLVGG